MDHYNLNNHFTLQVSIILNISLKSWGKKEQPIHQQHESQPSSINEQMQRLKTQPILNFHGRPTALKHASVHKLCICTEKPMGSWRTTWKISHTWVYPVRRGPDITMHVIDFATSSGVQWKLPTLTTKEHSLHILHAMSTSDVFPKTYLLIWFGRKVKQYQKKGDN